MEYMVVSTQLYGENGCFDGAMLIQDTCIQRMYKRSEIPTSFSGKVYDVGTMRVLPGIIEHHIHGFKGWSSFATSKEEICALANSLPSVGITSFVVTNHYRQTIDENARAIVAAMKEQKSGAKILGIHMEGPFINPETLGSISVDDTHAPSIELMQHLYDVSQGNIITVTLAPELPGNMEVIDWLVKHNINPCIGVTFATYEQCRCAVEHGAILTQKTGNCMGQLHHREVGAIGAALLESQLYNEINSDLAHCSKEFLSLLYQMKGYEKLLIVADSNRMSGMPPGSYEIPEEQGQYEVGVDGLLHLHDGTIDGSALSIIHGIRNWVETIHIPMEEAVVMASLNPAKIAHVDHRKGSLAIGKDADFMVLDDDYQVVMTFVEGTLAYQKGEGVCVENEVYKAYRKNA